MTSQPSTQALRVREKLLLNGAKTLSDAELLAVFISSGNAHRSCQQLAEDLIIHIGDMRAILTCDAERFQEVPGLGIVRYIQLQAMREMCRRSDFITLKQQKDLLFNNRHDMYRFLKRQLRDKAHETIAALFFNSQHQIITYEELFQGNIDTSSIYLRPIIKRLLSLNATSILLSHNHPSGMANASDEDVIFTAQLQEALSLIDVALIDHVIIGDNEVYSIMSRIKWTCY
jgi:DNA repair protein RadC